MEYVDTVYGSTLFAEPMIVDSHRRACARIALTIFCATRWLWESSRKPKRRRFLEAW